MKRLLSNYIFSYTACNHQRLFSLIFCVITYNLCLCQNQLKEVSQQYDAIVGQKNLSINNGIFNSADPLYIKGHDKYLSSPKYKRGRMTYNGQMYYDIELKYDLYKGILIYNPPNSSAKIGCSLSNQKIDSFSIYGRKFINIKHIDKWPKDWEIKNYMEKIVYTPTVTFYIIHDKWPVKVLKDNKIYYRYKSHNSFIIQKKSLFTRVSSKRDLLNLFPKKRTQINLFYDEETAETKVLFYKRLFTQLFLTTN